MTSKEFQKYLDRDNWACWHCGTNETLVPQHRAGRGMGGSKKQTSANVIVLCSLFNGLIESDAKAAGMAKRYGWKLSRYDRPNESPVYDMVAGVWWLLNDDFTKVALVE